MPPESAYHTPVLAREVIELLAPRPDGIYLDGTAGGGGHARSILEASAPGGRLFALDRDEDAVRAAGYALEAYGERVAIRQGNFREAHGILDGTAFDGILLDLGVSSHQLDSAHRGFSCDRNGPLDMRMDKTSGASVAEVLARIDQTELARAIREYGESRFSRKIARELVRRRDETPLTETAQLAEAIRSAVPRQAERKNVVQVFQALRILVNDELGALRDGLDVLFSMLVPGGRLAVISYHSLEDRLVKRFFSRLTKSCICPPQAPVCTCGGRAAARPLTRKPVRPQAQELADNPRSRSAKLRAVEKMS